MTKRILTLSLILLVGGRLRRLGQDRPPGMEAFSRPGLELFHRHPFPFGAGPKHERVRFGVL